MSTDSGQNSPWPKMVTLFAQGAFTKMHAERTDSAKPKILAASQVQGSPTQGAFIIAVRFTRAYFLEAGPLAYATMTAVYQPAADGSIVAAQVIRYGMTADGPPPFKAQLIWRVHNESDGAWCPLRCPKDILAMLSPLRPDATGHAREWRARHVEAAAKAVEKAKTTRALAVAFKTGDTIVFDTPIHYNNGKSEVPAQTPFRLSMIYGRGPRMRKSRDLLVATAEGHPPIHIHNSTLKSAKVVAPR